MSVNRRKNKSKKISSKSRIGSGKGIETLYRNAYRAELDLISLATTKSNIMISINGFIVSALIISGGFIDVSKPLLLGPATIFLFSSAISIYFALLAASPDTTPVYSKIGAWFSSISHMGKPEKYLAPESNILIYEDRAKLSKPEYLNQMRSLVTNQEQVYETMSDQLYWLGEMADRKFKMLKMSYAILRWGIIFSVVLFLGVKITSTTDSALGIKPSMAESMVTTPVAASTALVERSKFTGIYEPSAVQQLLDGTLLVLEDESARALNVVTLDEDGHANENDQQDKRLVKSFKRELNDLEGIALGKNGEVYAATSFSRTKKGKRMQTREQLLRFSIEEGELVSGYVYMDFGDFLRETDVFDDLSSINGGRNVDMNQMNIEALSFDAEKSQLLFGFREPLVADKSMVVRLENPDEVFSNQALPQLSNDISLLDLQGGGIRSLMYDARLDAYLIASEVRNKEGKNRSRLWLWSGDSEDTPQMLDIPSVEKMKNVEAITSVVVDGVPKVLLLSDDGNRNKNKPAHYLLLSYDQLGLEG